MQDVRVLYYRGHHPEELACTYAKPVALRTVSDAKQLVVWDFDPHKGEREKAGSYVIWSPYSGMLERFRECHPELTEIRRDDGRLVQLASGRALANGGCRQFDIVYILLVEDDWNKLSPRKPACREEPLSDLPDLGAAGSVCIIAPHELVADGNNSSESLPDFGIGVCDIIPECEFLATAQRNGRITFEEVIVPSAFDSLQLRRRTAGLLKGAGLESPVASVITEEVMLDLLARTWMRIAAESLLPQGTRHDLRILRELHFCGIEPSGSGQAGTASIGRKQVRGSRRFDFCIVDKATNRLLLAIEVDGEPHRSDKSTFERDRVKNEVVRSLNGLVIQGNQRARCLPGGYRPESDSFRETSFTCLRLPTDGTTCFELDGNESYLSIAELITDRLNQDLEPRSSTKVAYRNASDLDWGKIDPEGGDCSAADRNAALCGWGLIESGPKGWHPTSKGRELGIIASLFGEGQTSHCVYPPWAERFIAAQS